MSKTVRFKTDPESLFEAEKSGAKPNTVRILDAYEADLIRCNPPTKIIIQHQQEIFQRTLTDINLNYNVLGKVIAIFSWTNESDKGNVSEIIQPASIISSCEEPPLYVQAINISLSLREKLDISRGNRTYDEFLEELLKCFLDKQAYEREKR